MAAPDAARPVVAGRRGLMTMGPRTNRDAFWPVAEAVQAVGHRDLSAVPDAVEDDLAPVRLAQAVRGNRGACRVLGQCVHASNAGTLTLGQGQARSTAVSQSMW